LVEYVVNVALVFWYITLLSHFARESLGRFSVGRPIHFLATYLGEGVLALVLAHLFTRVGSWSVLAFIIPALFARQSLVRSQALEEMADRLRNRERLLERMMDRVVDERRDERLRIAADLHDDVLQALTSIWFLAKIVERQGGTPSGLREIAEGTESSIESLREVIHDLKESPVGRGGLVPTLRLLVRDLQLDWQTRVRLDSPSQIDLEPIRQILAYQIMREAIMNALKHAQATEIRAQIVQSIDSVVLTVEDDGTGFDVGAVDQASHFGLGLMAERVKRAGGRLNLESIGQTGTRLTATLPLSLVPKED
jgi:signal transduction histidine kinase